MSTSTCFHSRLFLRQITSEPPRACVSSIIQRVGAVPMSIAGIAKEVATISVSALLFGDELTPLNITGVAVTVCGKP